MMKQRKAAPGEKMQRGYCFAATVLAVLLLPGVALATTTGDDPLSAINNLSEFIFAAIRALGLILLGFGIVQIGLSMKSHDPSQRAQGFLTFFGGLIITFAKEILDLVMG